MNPEQWDLVLETTSPDETEKIGHFLGQNLTGGEVIAFEGDLGTGKTTFIRGIARGLEIPDSEASSPTFVFVHEHYGRLPLAHVDLFRIEKGDDLFDLGILDYLEGHWVVAIEWAEKAAGLLPENRLTIKLSDLQVHHRRLVLCTSNARYQPLLERLKENAWVPRNLKAS
jgi:tRNA threonylcarbamoyladenosine biosynthesis protein TsaE